MQSRRRRLPDVHGNGGHVDDRLPSLVTIMTRIDPLLRAAGEETTPEKDAAERGHPGTFADTEPQ